MLMFGWDFLLMLSRDSEDEMWSRFMFELLIWPQEVTLARWTQPSGPLCLWQCLDIKLVRLTKRQKTKWPKFISHEKTLYCCHIICGGWLKSGSPNWHAWRDHFQQQVGWTTWLGLTLCKKKEVKRWLAWYVAQHCQLKDDLHFLLHSPAETCRGV